MCCLNATCEQLTADTVLKKPLLPVGAVVGIWFPTSTFVTIGYDHCIANMYYLTLGLMLKMEGEDKYFFKDAIWRNIIPATLGNTVGGAAFVGALYWYVDGRA